MSYSSNSFLKHIGFDKNIKFYDNDGNLKYTVKPTFITNVIEDFNILKIILKSGKEIKLDFVNTSEPILAKSKLLEYISKLLENNDYVDNSKTILSYTTAPYNYNTFLRPIEENDRSIKILGIDLIVKYTIDPFTIINTNIVGNLLKINLKSSRVITLEFSTSNESKLAIIRLREQIEILTEKVPLIIDKDIDNYVVNLIDNKIFSATGATGFSYYGTSSTIFTIPEVGYMRVIQTQPNLEFTTDQWVIVSSRSEYGDDEYYVEFDSPMFYGKIDDYNKETGILNIVSEYSSNPGLTFSQWYINLSGQIGPNGLVGPTGSSYYGTSSTVFTIPDVGYIIEIQTQRNLAYTPDQWVVISNNSEYVNEYYDEPDSPIFYGKIDSYDKETGILNIISKYSNSLGLTFSQYYINLSGEIGPKGPKGSSYYGTSSTIFTIPEVGYMRTIQTNQELGYTPGQWVVISSNSEYGDEEYYTEFDDFMFYAKVDDYNDETGILNVISEYSTNPGLTFSQWYINLSGQSFLKDDFMIQITQSGTNNPTISSTKGLRGATLLPEYSDIGEYKITSSLPIFENVLDCYKKTNVFDINLSLNNNTINSWYFYISSDNTLNIKSFEGIMNNPINDVFTELTLIVIKYKS